jgi:biotin operon repressor
MGTIGQLKAVKMQLIRDLTASTAPLEELGEKYGVTRQAISQFAIKRGMRRPRRKHTDGCPICHQLMIIAKRHPSDFISGQTLSKKLKLRRVELSYHLNLLRESGLVAQHFGRIQSKKIEAALQNYFKVRIPIVSIGKKTGNRKYYSMIKKYKDLGWNITVPFRKMSRDV